MKYDTSWEKVYMKKLYVYMDVTICCYKTQECSSVVISNSKYMHNVLCVYYNTQTNVTGQLQ